MQNSKRNLVILAGIGLVIIASIIAFISFKSDGDNTYQYSVNTSSGKVEATNTGTIQTDVSSMLAYISEMSGNVKKVGAKWTYFLKESGEMLSVGDTIKTGDNGTATVTFSDNSVIRLNNNSEISFQKLSKEDTILDFKNGEIWARVLKPFYDTSFFTINTGDLSAWVRGTSVSIKIQKGKTQLEVIDSVAESEDRRGVTVTYKNPKTNESIEERILPKKRIILSAGKTPTVLKQDFRVDEIYANNFKRESTQKDIVLMDHLQKTSVGSKNLHDKVSWELAASLPKWTEIRKFFAENTIRSQITSLTGTIQPEDIILGIKKEVYITQVRSEVKETLDRLQQEATPTTQKAIEEKKSVIRQEMEKTIDGVIKAQDIDPLLNLESGTILREDGKESLYLSGTTLINISDKQMKEKIENRIEERKQEGVIKLQELRNQIPTERADTGAIAPTVTTPAVRLPTSPLPVIKPKVPEIVKPIMRPTVSGESRILPKPTVSGEAVR